MALQDEYSTNLGISVLPEFDQSKYPEIWGELMRLRASLKILQGALDTYTGALSEDPQYWAQTSPASSIRSQNISRVYAKATDTFTSGQAANFYNNAGDLGARLANATNNTKPCYAYATANITAGNYGQFIVFGILNLFSGLTPGTRYFLDTVNGGYTVTAPAVVGNIVQPVGVVLTPTTIYFNPTLNWTQL